MERAQKPQARPKTTSSPKNHALACGLSLPVGLGGLVDSLCLQADGNQNTRIPLGGRRML